MERERPFSKTLDQLRGAGLRPTRQRMALAKLLFDGENRHVSAESLHTEAVQARVRVSLATVYNTLHQFTKAGLLNEIVVDAGRSYFDTNVSDHHHFYNETTRELSDISGDEVNFREMPYPPEGQEISRVDVIIRVK